MNKNIRLTAVPISLTLVLGFTAVPLRGQDDISNCHGQVAVGHHGENIVVVPPGVDPVGVHTFGSVTSDCEPCLLGFGDDRYDFSLTAARDVLIEVADCCIEGDRYESRCNERNTDEDGDGDPNNHEEDCIVGREFPNVPVDTFANLGTVTLGPGDWTIRIRDVHFQADPPPCAGCAAGYTVQLTFSAQTNTPCAGLAPLGILPGGGACAADDQDPSCFDQAGPPHEPEGVAGKLDIKPGSCPNSFNRNSNGVLPVALVGTGDLDVNDVNLSTVLLSRSDGQGGSVAPLEGPPGPHSVVEDVATPFGGELCGCHELAGDGRADLSLKFKTQDVVSALQLGESSSGTTLELTLTGLLMDGSSFSAGDCIRLVPPGDGQMLIVNSRVAYAFIEASPPDELHDQGGFGSFVRIYPRGTVVRLDAPLRHEGWVFAGWAVTLGRQPLTLRGLPAGSGIPTMTVFVSSPVLQLPILYDEQSVQALFVVAPRKIR